MTMMLTLVVTVILTIVLTMVMTTAMTVVMTMTLHLVMSAFVILLDFSSRANTITMQGGCQLEAASIPTNDNP